MSNSELVIKGWLEKWGKRRYKRRWFQIPTGSATVKYFVFSVEGDEEGIEPKKERTLKDTFVVDLDDSGKEDSLFLLIEVDGSRPWYLRGATPKNKKFWSTQLANEGATKMTWTEWQKFKSYGNLKPSLHFPTLSGKEALTMRSEEKSLLQRTSTQMVTLFENAAKIGLSFVPMGGMIPLAAEGVVTGGAKIFQFFQSTDYKEMEKHLQDLIDKKIFKNNLERLQSEMATIERRQKMILDDKLTAEEKKTEVQVAIHNFEVILRLFHKDHTFVENAFMMAPYLATFTTLYLIFAQSAIPIFPAYTDTMMEGIDILEHCLLTYKEMAIQQRIGGIRLHSAYLSRYDYIADDKYPSDRDGVQSRYAYIDFTQHDSGQQFFSEYKTDVESLYAAYFDDILNNFKQHKAKLSKCCEFRLSDTPKKLQSSEVPTEVLH